MSGGGARPLCVRLGGEFTGPADGAQLRRMFDWFVGLDIVYETVSNLSSGVLVKSPEQLLDSIEAGLGGHCVEHAALLAALLRQAGFTASYVNADVHYPGADRSFDFVVRMAKPLVLVEVGAGRMICDPYYGRTLLPVPDDQPSVTVGEITLRRLGRSSFSVRRHRDGRPTAFDVVHEDSGLDQRRQLFQRRYAGFSPFGVTAPYYQRLRPVRRSVYYDPELDCPVLQVGPAVHRPPVAQVLGCDWIPPGIRDRLPEMFTRARGERIPAAAFLRSGAYLPHYRLLEPIPAVEPDGTRR